MPKALTPAQRADREAQRVRTVQQAWFDRMNRIEALKVNALETFEAKQVAARDFWLVLGIFETVEAASLRGRNESTKTRWFDGIAPRVRGGIGVSGFTLKAVAKLPEFLKRSGNGYVYLTDLGYALVTAMRERHAALRQVLHAHRPVLLSADYVVPPPVWRAWQVNRCPAP